MTSSTRPGHRLHGLVRDASQRFPSRPAVSGVDGELDYRTLDRAADALTEELADLGVRAGDRVILWLEKSVRAVVATQAVLRRGAAYVPVDDGAPLSRAVQVARDCVASLVLTSSARREAVIGAGFEALALSPRHLSPPSTVTPFDPDVGGGDDLAYVLYTSGSTGVPKGVCVSHRNALAFVRWAIDTLHLVPEDRLANHAALNFDLSVLDLYGAFGAAASVHILPDGSTLMPGRMVDFLERERISVWYSVPSALTLMMRHGELLVRPGLSWRAVLFAGEPFPVPQLRQLMARWPPPEVRYLNLYGPTETNVCTFYELSEIPEIGASVPIGRACSGDDVWVKRPDGQRAGPGESGELCVRGPTVMMGYFGQAAWGDRPYPTGDRVRLGPDGQLRFLGRLDDMLKIRGHRIEPAEVERVLTAHPLVADAAVVARGEGHEKRLVAFLVGVGEARPSLIELKRQLAAQLPPSITISECQWRIELPRNRNGKIDRSALAAEIDLAGSEASLR